MAETMRLDSDQGYRLPSLAVASTVWLAGCALSSPTPVDPAPLAESLVETLDGGMLSVAPIRVVASRDGRTVAFTMPRGPNGLPACPDELCRGWNTAYVVERPSRVPRVVCGNTAIHPTDTRGDYSWELSEDGRYFMFGTTRRDIRTCEDDNVDLLVEFPGPTYFRDGSGMAVFDRDRDAVRVAYFDGREERRIPITDQVYDHRFVSNREGTHLVLVALPLPDAPPEDLGSTRRWLIDVAAGTATELGRSALSPIGAVDGSARGGAVFTDDGAHVWTSELEGLRARRLDAATGLTSMGGDFFPSGDIGRLLSDDRVVGRCPFGPDDRDIYGDLGLCVWDAELTYRVRANFGRTYETEEPTDGVFATAVDSREVIFARRWYPSNDVGIYAVALPPAGGPSE